MKRTKLGVDAVGRVKGTKLYPNKVKRTKLGVEVVRGVKRTKLSVEDE